MASSQLSHLSFASAHRPSIATTFLIILVSVSLVPFFAPSSSDLIPSAFQTIAYTLWDSLLGIATSSPFYFFLLNFLIVALVFSSGVLDPSSKRRESAELQDTDLHQSDFYSAAQILNDRLALDEIYGSHAPSPSYLRLIERPNVYVVDEAQSDDGITEPAITSMLLQKPASTKLDASDHTIYAPSNAHSTISQKLDTGECKMTSDTMAVAAVVTSLDVANGDIADLPDEEGQHEDRPDVHKEDGDGDVRREDYEDPNCCSGAVESDVQSGVDCEDNDHNGKHNGDGDGDAFEECARSQAPMTQTSEMIGMAEDEQGADKESKWEYEEVSANGRDPKEENLGEGWSEEKTEEEQMMSREQLNERASAFITAFRRKLVSTARVED